MLDWPFQYYGLLIALLGTLVSLISIRTSQRKEDGKERPHFSFESILLLVGDSNKNRFYYESGSNTIENYADGKPVIVRLSHSGPAARNIRLDLLCETQYECCDSSAPDGNSHIDISYILSKSRIGKAERFNITYETVSDRIESQTWEYIHGTKNAKRIRK